MEDPKTGKMVEDSIRIVHPDKPWESRVVRIFSHPLRSDVLMLLFNLEGEKFLVSEPIPDSADIDGGLYSVPITTEGVFGPIEEYDWLWDDGVPADLPNNGEVPFWAIEEFRDLNSVTR